MTEAILILKVHISTTAHVVQKDLIFQEICLACRQQIRLRMSCEMSADRAFICNIKFYLVLKMLHAA